MASSRLRALPSTDAVLRSAPVRDLLRQFARDAVVRLVRKLLAEQRDRVAAGDPAATLDELARSVERHARAQWRAGPRSVINATGVLLHTNLGRAPLSHEALEAVSRVVGYSDLELNRETGGRGSRQDHVRRLLCALTGAESALVAVNNAAAVTLALAALARGEEVIVSRGQAVEIGGGFRVPVILRQSGARLVEVGTTNRTRLQDYEDAITPRTAALLHVHASNFRITGFTEQVSLGELGDLAHRHGVILIDDNGSGSLIETAQFGLEHEPTVLESLAFGADIIAFSGDKLLGGPQAGIVLGRKELVRRMGSHPLARAVRPDKMTLAALSATLLAYLRGDAEQTVPIWQMIGQTLNALDARVQHWASAAAQRGLSIHVEAGDSPVGGGSLPGETLPSILIVLPAHIGAGTLRHGEPPVVGRTHGGRVLLDLRSVPERQDGELLEAVCAAAGV
jgi:L-seryl-tRNA(Ser) seleniumtransferase